MEYYFCLLSIKSKATPNISKDKQQEVVSFIAWENANSTDTVKDSLTGFQQTKQS
jgi:hypothetical protein